jgi:hypothetical protein
VSLPAATAQQQQQRLPDTVPAGDWGVSGWSCQRTVFVVVRSRLLCTEVLLMFVVVRSRQLVAAAAGGAM